MSLVAVTEESSVSLSDLVSKDSALVQAASGKVTLGGGLKLPKGPAGRIYMLAAPPNLSTAGAAALFPSPGFPPCFYIEFDGVSLKLYRINGTVAVSWP